MAAIEHSEALCWLRGVDSSTVRAAIFDPPYAIKLPQRRASSAGQEHLSVTFAPFSFAWLCVAELARVLVDGGIVVAFTDARRWSDLGFMLTSNGLSISTTVAWVRNRPGTGGVFRGAWDPILIASRGTAAAVDRAAVVNWMRSEIPPGDHRHRKPVDLLVYILRRVCRSGDLVIDPFAGSGASREAAAALGCDWRGCDIDQRWANDGT